MSTEPSIPRCLTAQNWLNNQALFQDIKQGLSLEELAEKYGYTERWISNFKKRINQTA